jgi:predicted TIM-barrel fold metal-dependent hydrolase
MDLDGVWAQAPFPSFPGFAGNRFLFGKDKELARLCVQAYNDFILDEWRAAAPERYIGVIILPLWDIAACVSEIHRSAAKGARAISFPDAPAHLDLPSFHGDDWDPVFAACEETAMPLLMHFGGSRLTPWLSPDAPAAVRTTLFGATLYNSMTELAYSRVFTKHPQLQVAFAEGGIGWIPYAMMRMDQVWEHYRNYKIQPTVPNPDLRPSDLVRRHVWGCFIDDPVGLANREVIGVDRLLWESDYPHADSLWPHSREHAEKVFADIPSDEVRRIVCDNARELFRLDVASS